jgi:hypothetical protein
MRITETRRLGFAIVCAMGLLMTLPACSIFRGGGEPAPAGGDGALGEAETGAAGDPRDALDSVVAKHVAATARQEDEGRRRLVKRHPYFLKEYDVYPEGSDTLDTTIRETESRTAPYVADVKLTKQRFATEMQRKKDEARADDNFFRETGTETLTFEYRNGRWVKVGSLFVIERREENINGEWVPVKEEVDRALAAEEADKGWLGRFWETVTGR